MTEAQRDELRDKRRNRVLRYAEMMRSGLTMAAIARLENCSPARISQVMAFPRPVADPTHPTAPPEMPRPSWSYPDAITLDLVSRIRRETAGLL